MWDKRDRDQKKEFAQRNFSSDDGSLERDRTEARGMEGSLSEGKREQL